MSSKKRTADEPISNEETNEDSDSVLKQRNDAKRTKLPSINETTLQDLPIEMLECILIRAIAVEVKSMRLSKAVWRKKVDLVIDRLQTVCFQWKIILTSHSFQIELYKYLDDTARETIHMEILHQLTVPFHVFRVTTMENEIFLLCRPHGQLQDYAIKVCERNSKAVEVKHVIPLPGISEPCGMEACSVSKCLYVLSWDWNDGSVLRIAKDEAMQFNISTWITDPKMCLPILSVSANGSIVIISNAHLYTTQAVVRMYDATGSIQYEIMLSADIARYMRVSHVLQRPNGNLVMVSDGSQRGCGTQLTEIDARGNLIREHRSRVTRVSAANFADVHGRIIIFNWRNTIKLLDSELNLLNFTGPPLHHKSPVNDSSETSNESLEVVCHTNFSMLNKTTLTIFRFKEK